MRATTANPHRAALSLAAPLICALSPRRHQRGRAGQGRGGEEGRCCLYHRQMAIRRPDWPTHGLDAAETRFSRLSRSTNERQRLGLVWSYDLESTRGVEATPLVVDGSCMSPPRGASSCVDARTGRGCGPSTRGAAQHRLQGLLRCRQPRRRAVQGQGVCRLVRRATDRARCGDRQGAVGEGHDHRPLALVHDHRRTARLQGQRRDRQRRRRVRCPRLCVRLRRRNR